jgi:hypothetical protein
MARSSGKPFVLPRKELAMATAEKFRAKATEYAELLKKTDVPSEIRDFQRSHSSFNLLAQNQEWLAANLDKTIHSQDELQYDIGQKHADDGTPAETDEHILQCLGAAVIMQWNTIPTKLQRELFDNAGAMGELLQTPELRAQIARFLHNHKDDEHKNDEKV